MNEPIFISGMSRSGTTLLYTILNNHSNICLYLEAVFFSRVTNKKRKTKLTQAAVDIDKTIGEIRNLEENKIAPEVLKSAFLNTDQRLISLYDTLLKLKMRQNGKKRFGEKMPGNFLYLDILFKYYPDAKIIFITRDPRHTFCSFKHNKRFKKWKLPIIDKSLIGRSLFWTLYMKHKQKYQKSAYNKQITCVKFEDIIKEPHKTVSAICEFLNEKYDKNMLNVNMLNSSFDELEHKSGIRKEVLQRIHLLNTREKLFIELICGKYMLQGGYAPLLIRRSVIEILETMKFYFCLEWCHFCWRKIRSLFDNSILR